MLRSRVRRFLLQSLLFSMLLLGACADRNLPLLLSDAWVRTPPPGAAVAAGFVGLRNTDRAALTIATVTADVAGRAEIHDMEMQDGVMRMRQLTGGLTLAPGEQVLLAPGGKHVMLFDLQRRLRNGDAVQLRFHLADGREVSATLPVQDTAP